MKIDFPVTGFDGTVIAVVPAEIVDVAPHLPLATWVAHRCDSYAPWVWDKWRVSNLETGCGSDEMRGRTKKAAVETARRVLKSKTTQLISKRMAKKMKEMA